MINKEEILAKKCVCESVHIKSLGGEVNIRVMSGTERIRLVAGNTDDGTLDAMLGFILFAGNEDGTRMFDDDQLDEVGELDGRVVQEVLEAGLRVNGLTVEEEAAEAGN